MRWLPISSVELLPRLALASLMLGWSSGCNRGQSEEKKEAPLPEVIVALPEERAFTPFAEFPGRTEALKTVQVRARVAGYLDKILFHDGDSVDVGAPLFQIDPGPYAAEDKRAQATIRQAETRVRRLAQQLARAQKLVGSKAITQEEFELIEADHAEAEAALDVAKSSQRLTELNLGYSTIKSPLKGKISRRLVDVGNLVKPDDTLLATIIQLDPLYAFFEIDERTVLQLRRAGPRGTKKSLSTGPDKSPDGPEKSLVEQNIQVRLFLTGETESALGGVIDYADNELDVNTGTLRVRVKVDNPKLLVSPGFFIRCQMPLGAPRKAICVPEEALQADQGQRFLYVLNENDEVQYRRVNIGPLLSGWRVIEDNLKLEERVVISGQQRVKPGKKAAPTPAGEKDLPAVATAKAGGT